MCVVYFAYKVRSDYPLILLANRDEYYSRPTERAKTWEDFPDIIGGRDLANGGTWLGITKTGRIAAVTNYRDPCGRSGVRSRGVLTADFLKCGISTAEYLKKVAQIADEFSGFNLLVGEINSSKNELYYFSNRAKKGRRLRSGIYGLSNHLLDTPWPKVQRGKRFLESGLAGVLDKEECFAMLTDETRADDADRPDTGIGCEREKLLSSIFIRTADYGTRSSTVITVDREYNINLDERVHI